MTFHWRGITSSVSVTSSPIFTIRAEPRQVQAAGASITTRSRGRCSGKALRDGRRRSLGGALLAVATALSTVISSSVAVASSSSSCNSSWSISRVQRSDDAPYRARFSWAISSFNAEINASELDTTARTCTSSALVAASSARSFSSSDEASDMAIFYHADP